MNIPTLHKTYSDLSGLPVRLDYDRERAWFLFIKAGFTLDDLKLVLIHLRAGIRKGIRFPASMGFTRLIWGLDVFEEELVLARAEQRNKPNPVTNRETVLQVFRPEVEQSKASVNTKSTADLVPKLIAELRKAAQ